LLLSAGGKNVKIKRAVSTLLLILALVQVILTVGGCSSARQKFDDCKRYFLTEVARW
jgi:hypothetical protein